MGSSTVGLRDATVDGQVNAGNMLLSIGRPPDIWRTFFEAQEGARQASADEMGDRPWWCLGEPMGELTET